MNLNQRPFIIAGPCAAESREQVFKTAELLKDSGKVNLFRAGVWKPRTMPGNYEGPGEAGLGWLEEIQKNLEIPVTTEVATPAHVELALKHGIRWFWIGARSTVNPFLISELASSLKGEDVTVMIKNPINADISLWIGAIERIKNAGIENLMAIHRGFTSLTPDPYRFAPIWKIPLEIIRRYPDIPMICDPSHISGTTDHIASLSQKAMDLNMKGLMVEVHNNPEAAKSDKKQQITPDHFIQMVSALKLRQSISESESYKEKLDGLRDLIDEIDHEIIDQLARRMEVIKEIAKLKHENNIKAFQLERFQDLSVERASYGERKKLSKSYITELFNTIHEDAVKLQSDLMKKL